MRWPQVLSKKMPASVRALPAGRKAEAHCDMVTKNAKLFRHEELQTQVVQSMVDSAKRKLDALKERNALFRGAILALVPTLAARTKILDARR